MLSLVGMGASCEPPPPPPPTPLFFAKEGDVPDAAPGDGVCATSEGWCTLRAAIDEGNALGRADIVLHGANYQFASTVEVTGAIRINWERPNRYINLWVQGAPVFRVLPEGSLKVESLRLQRVEVRGEFTAYRSGFESPDHVPLVVSEGAVVLIRSSTVRSLHAGVAIDNAGTLVVDYSRIGAPWGSDGAREHGSVLSTRPSGVTYARGTWLAGSCTGTAVVSLGYTADAGDACGLTGASDLVDQPMEYYPEGSDVGVPPPALRDAIPHGQIGCGTAIASDISGRLRPTDTDGDRIAACEIDAYEYSVGMQLPRPG